MATMFITIEILSFLFFVFWTISDPKLQMWLSLTLLCSLEIAVLYMIGFDSEISSVSSFIMSNPATVLGMLMVYLFAGFIWSIIKWYLVVYAAKTNYANHAMEVYEVWNKEANRIRDDISMIEKIENLDEAGAKQLEKLNAEKDLIFNKYKSDIKRLRSMHTPDIKSHTSDVISWVVYWPFFCAWTIIPTTITTAVKRTLSGITSIYSSITERMFSVK